MEKVEKKEIMILIVEDTEVAREIVHEHFGKNKVTYANIIDADKRDEVVKLLEVLEQ